MSLFCHCGGRHAIGTQSPCLKTRFIRPVRTRVLVIGLGIGVKDRFDYQATKFDEEIKKMAEVFIVEVLLPAPETVVLQL